MKPSGSSKKIRSFKELKRFLDNRSISLPSHSPVPKVDSVTEHLDPKTEKQAFLEAMAGVTPLPNAARMTGVSGGRCGKLPMALEDHSDAEAMEKLNNLVKYGSGFIVSSTPEYMEGTGFRVHPAITRRLHQGEFSIQAHIDLHGMSVDAAREAFEAFLKRSVLTGKRAVLIVHGRGLSSPSRPVLKTKVYDWLTTGYWRKWVIAFASAKSHDGGAGATYVLLRQRPLAKRHRKRKKHWLNDS